MCECVQTQLCLTLCNAMDCSPPASSMRFSMQKYWSGLPLPSPGDLPNQGLNLYLLHCRQIFDYCATQEALIALCCCC